MDKLGREGAGRVPSHAAPQESPPVSQREKGPRPIEDIAKAHLTKSSSADHPMPAPLSPETVRHSALATVFRQVIADLQANKTVAFDAAGLIGFLDSFRLFENDYLLFIEFITQNKRVLDALGKLNPTEMQTLYAEFKKMNDIQNIQDMFVENLMVSGAEDEIADIRDLAAKNDCHILARVLTRPNTDVSEVIHAKGPCALILTLFLNALTEEIWCGQSKFTCY